VSRFCVGSPAAQKRRRNSDICAQQRLLGPEQPAFGYVAGVLGDAQLHICVVTFCVTGKHANGPWNWQVWIVTLMGSPQAAAVAWVTQLPLTIAQPVPVQPEAMKQEDGCDPAALQTTGVQLTGGYCRVSFPLQS